MREIRLRRYFDIDLAKNPIRLRFVVGYRAIRMALISTYKCLSAGFYGLHVKGILVKYRDTGYHGGSVEVLISEIMLFKFGQETS
jgi:hypothetical protein